MEFNGGCACSGLRYQMTDRPLFIHCCHCTWCQRETGSAFVLNALIEARKVKVTKGMAEDIATPSESGMGQRIFRCPTCHVAVWSIYSGAGDRFLFLRVGTLDQAGDFPPDIHIYTSTKQPWVQLPEGVPAHSEYYRRSLEWPAASLERRTAELARPD